MPTPEPTPNPFLSGLEATGSTLLHAPETLGRALLDMEQAPAESGNPVLHGLGMGGRALSAIPAFLRDVYIGPSENVGHRERARRIVSALAMGGNPAALASMQQDWQKQDAATSGMMADPIVQKRIAELTPTLGPRGAFAQVQAETPALADYRPTYAQTAQGEQLSLPPTMVDRLKVDTDQLNELANDYRRAGKKVRVQVDTSGKAGLLIDDETNRHVMKSDDFIARHLGALGYEAELTETPGWVNVKPPPDLREYAGKKAIDSGTKYYERTGDPSQIPGAAAGAPQLGARPGLVPPGEAPMVGGPRIGTDELDVQKAMRVEREKAALKDQETQKKGHDQLERDQAFIESTLAPIRELITQLPVDSYPDTLGGMASSAKRKYLDVPLAREFKTNSPDNRVINKLGTTAAYAVTNIGRRFGERGVFTNQDAERFLQGLDVAALSKQAATDQVDSVSELMRSMVARDSERLATGKMPLGDGEYEITYPEFRKRVYDGLRGRGYDVPESAAASPQDQPATGPGGASNYSVKELEEAAKEYGINFDRPGAE